jgi:hypothetical protein
MGEDNKRHLQGQIWQIFANFSKKTNFSKENPPGQVFYSPYSKPPVWIAIWFDKEGNPKEGAVLEDALKKEKRKITIGTFKLGKNKWNNEIFVLIGSKDEVLAKISYCFECGAWSID